MVRYGWDSKVAVASLLLFITILSCVKYSDYDYWWHAKRGEQIYTTGDIWQVDMFSYSFAGKPQFSGEWLADLVIFFSQAAGGLAGSYALLIGVIGLTFFFLCRAMRERHGGTDVWLPAAISVLLLLYLAMQFRFFIRPYIFSYLFTAIFVSAFLCYEQNRRIKPLYALPAIQLLWSNMSSAAIFGPMLFLMFLVVTFFDRRKSVSSNQGQLLLLFAATSLLSLINPEGINLYLSTITHSMDSFVKTGGEFQPLSFEMLWGYGIRYTYAYQLLVLLAAIYFIFMGGWRRLFHVMLFLFFLAQSVLYIRMISFASLVACLFAVVPVTWFLQKLLNSMSIKSAQLNIGLSAVVLMLIPAFIVANPTYSFGIGINEKNLPEGALSFIEREGIEGRMFNSYHLGGYIIWRLPDRKVLIDGRLHHLYDEEIYRAYKGAFHEASGWQALEQEWGFDYAILDYDLLTMEFPLHLNSNKEWALVYWDSRSAVYLKRTEQNRDIISRHEYHIVKPNFNDFTYLDSLMVARRSPGMSEQIVRQLDRELARTPKNQEVRLARLFMLFNLGRLTDEAGMKEIEITLAQEPDISMEHAAAAYFHLRKGHNELARQEVAKALVLNPEDQQAKDLQAQLQ